MDTVEEVKEIFISSFKKLYQTEQCCCPLNHQWNLGWCVKLNSEEVNNIAHITSYDEIWSALKSMKPYKALGSKVVDTIPVSKHQRFVPV